MTISEKEKDALKQASLKLGFVFALIGAIGLVVALLPLGLGYFSLVAFVAGIGVMGVGLAFLTKGADLGEEYLVRKRASPSIVDDEKGIVWVWVVAICAWAIMAIAYFALSTVLYIVLDSVEAWAPWSGHAWESQYMATIELTRNVCAWFLIIMTVGLLMWALINSARREDQTFPAY